MYISETDTEQIIRIAGNIADGLVSRAGYALTDVPEKAATAALKTYLIVRGLVIAHNANEPDDPQHDKDGSCIGCMYIPTNIRKEPCASCTNGRNWVQQ